MDFIIILVDILVFTHRILIIITIIQLNGPQKVVTYAWLCWFLNLVLASFPGLYQSKVFAKSAELAKPVSLPCKYKHEGARRQQLSMRLT